MTDTDAAIDVQLAQALLSEVQRLAACSYTEEGPRGAPKEASPALFRQVHQFLAHYDAATGEQIAQLWDALHTELRKYVEWVCENSTAPAAFDIVRRFAHDPVALLRTERKARTQKTLTSEEAGVVSALRLVKDDNNEATEHGINQLFPGQAGDASRRLAGQ